MKENTYVLAMYDIRAKQAFIYNTTSIKEIIGASLLIRDCFTDYLYPSAETVGRQLKGNETGKGIFHTDWEHNVDFTPEGFEKHLEEGYIGELIYDGGGNFLLVYQDLDAYKSVNYEFSKRVLEEVGTLQILPTCIDGLNYDDYEGDRKKLYDRHKIDEGRQSFVSPCGTLPIVQVDYSTSQPLVAVNEHNEKLSKESLAKYKKFKQFIKESKGSESPLTEVEFDKMVEERGKESLLAVIYADGNNMGAKVAKVTGKSSSYEDCIHELRRFSHEIQKSYIDDRKKDIDKLLEKKYPKNGKRRFVIGSGDEITFVCNARHAFDIMNEYLSKLPDGCSSCAGAAVFHSHAPYSEAYRIAEECCESGKSFMKENGISGEACFMDFYYCQGAIGTSLKAMRDEEVGDLNSKPWLVDKNGTDEEARKRCKASMALVDECRTYLNNMGRSNVKGLAEAAKAGPLELTLELKRIRAHMKKEERGTVNWDLLAKNPDLVFDMVSFYDIWFDDRKAGAGK